MVLQILINATKLGVKMYKILELLGEGYSLEEGKICINGPIDAQTLVIELQPKLKRSDFLGQIVNSLKKMAVANSIHVKLYVTDTYNCEKIG